jgi:hypothetical protein
MNLERVVRGEFTDEERLHTALSATLRSNGASPEAAFALLGKVARERTWEHLPRYVKGEQPGRFWSFTDYVESSTNEGGLGMSTDDVRALVKVRTEVERRPGISERAVELVVYRKEIVAELDRDLEPAAKHGANQHSNQNQDCVAHTPNSPSMTHDSIVSRLKRDDPELAESVVRGEITANAAARAKGWRYPRVELRNPITVAARIKATFTPEQIAQLITELTHTEV